jgi:hypothetical protein
MHPFALRPTDGGRVRIEKDGNGLKRKLKTKKNQRTEYIQENMRGNVDGN